MRIMQVCRLSILFLTAISVAGCFRPAHSDIVVHVPQMRSAVCARAIQDALSGLDGIIAATPDVGNQTVTVRYQNEKLAVRNVEFVIAGAGFAANDVPANEAARSKLAADCR